MRALWFITGLFAVALGLIGIVLPLLPTVPFMILAAFCFSNSSDRWHRWLVNHPVYGPHIRDWRDHRAIRPRAKRLSTLMILAAFAISILLGVRPAILAVQALVLSCVMIFIWTRPDH